MESVLSATDAPSVVSEPGSFRDRSGRVFYHAGEVYRALSAAALADWERLAATQFYRRLMGERKLITTERIAPEQLASGDVLTRAVPGNWCGVLKHAAVPFVSYPYEWSFGMLRDAALLQLELLEAAVDEGMTLKDGSAFNVQWFGSRPVFIDIGSFETLAPGAAWAGYRQFCQLCLFPLLLQAYKNVPFHPWLRGNLDGMDVQTFRGLFSLRDWLRPGVFKHVVLHAMLAASLANTRANVKTDLQQAGFHAELIRANARSLRRLLTRLNWKQAHSTWSDYATQNSYLDADRQQKEAFVRGVTSARRWGLVWDLGCNTGVWSRIAAETADYVVAIDSDHLAVERLYQSLRSGDGPISERILPLVGNLADASPALGWRGAERKPLAERGRPDLTLCLALVHHLVIGANLPLRELIDWFHGLGSDLVIEFVGRDDPMVQTLLRHKTDLYTDYDPLLFERWLGEAFTIRQRLSLPNGTRTLYYAQIR